MKASLLHSVTYEAKEHIALSIPLVAAWLIYALSGFIGTAMIAHVSEDALAAGVLITTIWTALTIFSAGVFSAMGVLTAQHYGARHYSAIGYILSQAILLGTIICCVIILIMQCSAFILHWSFQRPPVLQLATQYAHALLWSTPSVVLLSILEYFLIGIGRTKLSLWISLLQVPLEVLFMYMFIFGKFGLPVYGIAGVGYGLTASFTIIVLMLILYLYHDKAMQPYQLFKSFGCFDPSLFNELIRIGLPVGLMYLIEVTAFVVATFFIAHFNTASLAAHQIAMQYFGVTISIASAVSQVVTTRVGHSIGRGNRTEARYAGWVGLGIGFLLMLMICCIYFFYSPALLQLDLDTAASHNSSLVKQALALLAILSIFQLLDSIRLIEAGALRGLKDTRFSMYISLVTFWLIGLTSAYLLGFVYHWQAIGVWAGMTLGVAIAAIILFLRLYYMLNHRLDMISFQT